MAIKITTYQPEIGDKIRINGRIGKITEIGKYSIFYQVGGEFIHVYEFVWLRWSENNNLWYAVG